LKDNAESKIQGDGNPEEIDYLQTLEVVGGEILRVMRVHEAGNGG